MPEPSSTREILIARRCRCWVCYSRFGGTPRPALSHRYSRRLRLCDPVRLPSGPGAATSAIGPGISPHGNSWRLSTLLCDCLGAAVVVDDFQLIGLALRLQPRGTHHGGGSLGRIAMDVER
jgi:hypothetical protein